MSHEKVPAPGRFWTCCDRIEQARVDEFEYELGSLYSDERREHGEAYARLAMANRASGAHALAEICGASAELQGMLQGLTVRLEDECGDDLPEVAHAGAN